MVVHDIFSQKNLNIWFGDCHESSLLPAEEIITIRWTVKCAVLTCLEKWLFNLSLFHNAHLSTIVLKHQISRSSDIDLSFHCKIMFDIILVSGIKTKVITAFIHIFLIIDKLERWEDNKINLPMDTSEFMRVLQWCKRTT